MNKVKITIFSEPDDIDVLERCVNEWLWNKADTIRLIDSKFSTVAYKSEIPRDSAGVNYDTLFSVCLIYEDLK